MTLGHAYDSSCLSPGSSNVTDLGFKRCKLGLGGLGGLLQGMKALKEFRYIYEDTEPLLFGPVRTTAVTDLAEMRKLLLKHTGPSLELLDLLRVNEEPVRTGWEPPGLRGSAAADVELLAVPIRKR